MKVKQQTILNTSKLELLDIGFQPDLILLFISPGYNYPQLVLDRLVENYPDALITGCSTSGEIADTIVQDNSIIANFIHFEKTECRMASSNMLSIDNSFNTGQSIVEELKSDSLNHIFILSDGLQVNGNELVKGMKSKSGKVGITGGLAGDGTDFNNTFVVKQNELLSGQVVAIGLYGEALQVGYSSKGGWNSFGIEREVTKSEGCVLYEIDNKPALELYKSYLGPKAEDLPSAGLLFPLSIRVQKDQQPLVRTILNINEEDQSLIFTGDIPTGSYARLMKGNADRLITGAEDSAKTVYKVSGEESDFALLISCVSRRLVLKQLVEEEVEVVREVLGSRPVLSGFYSYGELAPFDNDHECQLHNQTMTITTFSEAC